ncbi:MAG TPA: MarR family transcriptional regulator [Candidatus Dormibacteraeota bacterium]|nr:MarR family transcriptional regulator [Candidatus Dormibacteraeota bacterium]
MTRNFEAAPSVAPAPSAARPDRESVAAVLEELGGWEGQDRHSMLRRWHRGALSLIHLHVLSTLEADGPTSMSHLAETLDVSVASATGIVDRMERRGLVARRHDTSDRRVVLVELTSAGREVFRDLPARRREHLARLLSELSDDELGAFLVGVRALRAARTRLLDREDEAEATAATASPATAVEGAR